MLWLFAALVTYFDLRYRIVPNWLILGGLACGLALATVSGLHALSVYGPAFLLGFLLLLPAFCFRMVGGGDVKSMAVVGLLAGPHILWIGFLRGSILGGMIALAILTGRLWRRVPCGPSPTAIYHDRGNGGGSIPYAAILVLSAVFSTLL